MSLNIQQDNTLCFWLVFVECTYVAGLRFTLISKFRCDKRY